MKKFADIHFHVQGTMLVLKPKGYLLPRDFN